MPRGIRENVKTVGWCIKNSTLNIKKHLSFSITIIIPGQNSSSSQECVKYSSILTETENLSQESGEQVSITSPPGFPQSRSSSFGHPLPPFFIAVIGNKKRWRRLSPRRQLSTLNTGPIGCQAKSTFGKCQHFPNIF